MKRFMRLGLFVHAAGHHSAGWRHPEAEFGSLNFDLIQRLANEAENACFDMVFFGDKLSTSTQDHPSIIVRFEPVALLGALSVSTTRIGLAATASTTYSEPYQLARQFATLDHLSRGRVGWNVVTSAYDVAHNFTQPTHPDHADRYATAHESVQVVKGLWDSWEDDALVGDKSSGQFMDSKKLHTLDHHGEHYHIAGPLNITRGPQGHPVLIQAGSSPAGIALAAATAEVVFTAQQSLSGAQQFYRTLKQQVVQHHRQPEHCLVMPGVMPLLGDTDEDAWQQLAELQAFSNPQEAFRLLNDRLGHDVSGYPLDQPLPELPGTQAMQSRARLLLDLCHKEGRTLADLLNLVSAARGHWLLVGSPQTVADQLIRWFDNEAADGFNIMPAWFPGGLTRFIDQVLPLLRARGYFRSEYQGSTLREHLGLPKPANRYQQETVNETDA
ncbi:MULTISPECIES: LLM class flavin-dependent oxidoreductase [unclassified Pantoea]|uniref:LLM class flavin-dependent oxidoreductase n=1 Tax=unclassified Pantoea TaxID=2630326 RepID=UPI001CD2A5E3|nr:MULTISPECIES: LLM class flavin-dependent oxidoreductase [unclassified Pantoea]MCA1177353.1 LLM class flavin-dependent oxidoreductase [Pantoea sp. alder69]MCA1249741.1 LLM class flavin-dependent oxidoreductase [Pantoea sp. alder70]MCA1265842.1 LLM class flavin-dependent oxidoreductase [Pantoea sp. alder81]